MDNHIGLPHIVAAVSLVFALFHLCRRYFEAQRLPPGPKRRYLAWNTVPLAYNWLEYESLAKLYGPIFTLYRGLTPVVVITSHADAVELMEKATLSTGSRPELIVGPKYLRKGDGFAVRPSDDRWRLMRRVLHSQMTNAAASGYERHQERCGRQLVVDILSDPSQYAGHARSFGASIINSVVYGKRSPTSYKDREVATATAAVIRGASTTQPGRYLVDSFPVLQYFPAKWKRNVFAWAKEDLELYKKFADEARELYQKGEADIGLGVKLFDGMRETGLTLGEVYNITGNMFGAGVDTTSGTLVTAMMAACTFSEVQRKAQEELDRVVGRDRPPSWSDRADLPYVEAFCKEVERWRPTIAGGIVHSVTKAIHYKGFLIPKGADILGCHWTVGHDPEVFPDPDPFKPERFLQAGQGGKITLNNLQAYPFGFGRRACIGKEIAQRSLFIGIALLLWSFEFKKKVDPQTNEAITIDTSPRTGFTGGMVSQAKPFQFDIVPRIEEKIVQREMENL